MPNSIPGTITTGDTQNLGAQKTMFCLQSLKTWPKHQLAGKESRLSLSLRSFKFCFEYVVCSTKQSKQTVYFGLLTM